MLWLTVPNASAKSENIHRYGQLVSEDWFEIGYWFLLNFTNASPVDRPSLKLNMYRPILLYLSYCIVVLGNVTEEL